MAGYLSGMSPPPSNNVEPLMPSWYPEFYRQGWAQYFNILSLVILLFPISGNWLHFGFIVIRTLWIQRGEFTTIEEAYILRGLDRESVLIDGCYSAIQLCMLFCLRYSYMVFCGILRTVCNRFGVGFCISKFCVKQEIGVLRFPFLYGVETLIFFYSSSCINRHLLVILQRILRITIHHLS